MLVPPSLPRLRRVFAEQLAASERGPLPRFTARSGSQPVRFPGRSRPWSGRAGWGRPRSYINCVTGTSARSRTNTNGGRRIPTMERQALGISRNSSLFADGNGPVEGS